MGRVKAVRLMAAQSDCDMLSICIYFHEINVGCYEFCSQENGSHCSLRAVALNDNVEELNPIKISESSIKTCSLITCWSHLALLRSANLNLQGEIKWKPEWLTLTSSPITFLFLGWNLILWDERSPWSKMCIKETPLFSNGQCFIPAPLVVGYCNRLFCPDF